MSPECPNRQPREAHHARSYCAFTSREYRGRGSLLRRAKTAQVIPEYLQSQGYRIIPVNPKGGEILGERVYFCREGGPIEVLMRYGVATLTTEKGRE